MLHSTARWYPNQIALTCRIMMEENAPLSVVVMGNFCHDRLFSMGAEDNDGGGSHGP